MRFANLLCRLSGAHSPLPWVARKVRTTRLGVLAESLLTIWPAWKYGTGVALHRRNGTAGKGDVDAETSLPPRESASLVAR